MFCKSLVLFGLVAVARAGFLHVGAVRDVIAKIENFDPSHNFGHGSQHSLTSDSTAHYKTKNGERIEGNYRLIEADGTEKIVRYTVDDVNGFNAVISREPVKTVDRLTIATANIAQNPAGARDKSAKLEDFDSSPEYNFEYDVEESLSDDSKTDYETKKNDRVQGSYGLIEIDGNRKIGHYTSDDVNGFKAVPQYFAPAAAVSAPPTSIVAPQGVTARAAYISQYPASAIARIAAPLTYAAAGYTG